MKKLFLVACVAAFCLTGCNNGKNDSAAQNTAQADSLNGIIAQKDSEINDLMGTLNEIEEGFQQISEAEHRVSLAKDGEGVNKKQKLKEEHHLHSHALFPNRCHVPPIATCPHLP